MTKETKGVLFLRDICRKYENSYLCHTISVFFKLIALINSTGGLNSDVCTLPFTVRSDRQTLTPWCTSAVANKNHKPGSFTVEKGSLFLSVT